MAKKYRELVEHLRVSSLSGTEALLDDVIKESYFDIPKEKIASIISKHHDTKVTDSLIEAYIEIAAERKFTLDETILAIREQNRLDRLEFILEDQSKIVLTQESLDLLKPYLNEDAISFMRESKENFMQIFELIQKENNG